LAPASAGRWIIVNQGVATALKHPQSLGRISPVDHRVEAMLLVLFDLGQAMGAPSGEEINLSPCWLRVELVADRCEHRHFRLRSPPTNQCASLAIVPLPAK
jgi:hypothetical protein